jgi:ribosomal RNA methyltransferase Nop2
VLLDAPCSGTGIISKDPQVKINKSKEDLDILTKTQKELILCAIDAIDATKGGILVYSTCSVLVEENEEIVQYLLDKRSNCKLVDTGLGFGRDGFSNFRGKRFSEDMKKTKRWYPHTHNMDGFYVAKIQKTSNTYKGMTKGVVLKKGGAKPGQKKKKKVEQVVEFDTKEDEQYLDLGVVEFKEPKERKVRNEVSNPKDKQMKTPQELKIEEEKAKLSLSKKTLNRKEKKAKKKEALKRLVQE